MAQLTINIRNNKKKKIENNIKEILKINSSHDVNLLEKGLIFMYDAHEEQWRMSGKPYTDHTIAVGKYLAPEFRTIDVVSGYLHDVPQKTKITVEIIRDKFGDEIGDIVDDMTQRERESNKEYAHRIIKNKRAIPVRLGDKRHNFETDNVFKYEKRIERAKEVKYWLIEPARAEFGHYQLFKDVEDEVYSRLDDLADVRGRRYFLGKVASLILLGSRKYPK